VQQYGCAATRLADYAALFAPTARASAPPHAIGDRSAGYLYWPTAAERIHHYLPQARLIAILRQPADRAYAHYLRLRQEGREPFDFAEALRHEETRLRRGWGPAWHYRQFGYYAAQLERYCARFDPARLRVYLHEDWQTGPAELLRDACAFLEVDPARLPPALPRYAPRRQARSRAWHAFLTRPHPLKDRLRQLLPRPLADRLWTFVYSRNLSAQRLDPALRAELTDGYREDILRLQDLIGRDLSQWLTP
jgi:hypothetical protein